jgi:prepilin-type N-terminal cleavage/methylation domain-containing protein
MTLLEVMVAMGIAAIVLVAVYRLQTQSIGMEGVAAFHTQAPLLARQVLAAVERQGPDYPSTDSGDFGADYPGYGWTADTGDVPDFVDPSGRALLKQIDIRIHLNQDQDVFALRTFRLVTAGD